MVINYYYNIEIYNSNNQNYYYNIEVSIPNNENYFCNIEVSNKIYNNELMQHYSNPLIRTM